MTKKTAKIRLDKLLVDLALVSTRARAQAMIIAGKVLVNDVPITKAGELVSEDALIRLKEPELKYVSRGALKLIGALDHFNLNPQGKCVIDVGASTGGFTEVVLERGAKHVYAVDVGSNQLAWKLRADPRVTSMENYNVRNIRAEDFTKQIEFLVMDVSFISIRLLIPMVMPLLSAGAPLVVLFKPQFEVGREFVGEGGIVTNLEAVSKSLGDVLEWGKKIGLQGGESAPASITGTDGNQEYFINWFK